MLNKLKILVIATSPNERLRNTLERRGHSVTVVKPTDFSIYISSNPNGYDRLYLKDEPFPSKSYDAVISRVGQNVEFAAKVLYHLQKNFGVWCVQSGRSIEICRDKVISAQIASVSGLRVPKQFYCTNAENPHKLIKKLGGLPVMLKEITGSKGKGIICLESPLQTNMTLESYYGSGRKIILQEFLNTRTKDSGGHDERHIVVNGKIVSSMERIAPTDDIRANLSLDGKGRKIEPTQEVRDMCAAICSAIPGLLFAGVDIMHVTEKDKDGNEVCKPYFIEINSNPGELIIDVTGHNHFEDLADFIENNYKNKELGTQAKSTFAQICYEAATGKTHRESGPTYEREETMAAVYDAVTDGGRYPGKMAQYFKDLKRMDDERRN